MEMLANIASISRFANSFDRSMSNELE